MCRVCTRRRVRDEYKSRDGRRVTSTLMKQTSFLRHTLVSRRRVADDTSTMATTHPPPFPPPVARSWRLKTEKVGAPRVNGFAGCWGQGAGRGGGGKEKSARARARILSPPIRACGAPFRAELASLASRGERGWRGREKRETGRRRPRYSATKRRN